MHASAGHESAAIKQHVFTQLSPYSCPSMPTLSIDMNMLITIITTAVLQTLQRTNAAHNNTRMVYHTQVPKYSSSSTKSSSSSSALLSFSKTSSSSYASVCCPFLSTCACFSTSWQRGGQEEGKSHTCKGR